MIFGIVCGVQKSLSTIKSMCVCVCYLWLLRRISSQHGQEVMNWRE